jgi:hypothetical protein
MAHYDQAAVLAAELFDQGCKVERSDLGSVVWPQAPFNLFTITGGRILVRRLMQEVTVANCDAVATTVKFSITTAAPYAVATVDLCTASGSLTGLAIGGRVQLVGDALATQAAITATIGPGLNVASAPLVLTPGIISVTSAGAAMTGLCVVVTSLWYQLIDDGAIVVPS